MYVTIIFPCFRLNQDRHGGAWCPKNAIKENTKEWLEVNLRGVHIITGLVTQVRILFTFYSIHQNFHSVML